MEKGISLCGGGNMTNVANALKDEMAAVLMYKRMAKKTKSKKIKKILKNITKDERRHRNLLTRIKFGFIK